MNIVYLHSHDTGRAIEPYGYAVNTPTLQQLAEDGVLFRNAHCAAPTCSPSRAALLTGESAHNAGMVALAHRGGKLLHPERHLANFLKGHGYETARAGASHVGLDAEGQGYTNIFPARARDCDAVTQNAVDYISDRDDDAPFFLDVGYVETHRTEWVCHGFNQEHHSPKDGEGNTNTLAPPAILPDTPEMRRDWLDYRHAVERLDTCYGRIIDALEQEGILDNTLVIATTDHGLAMPGMKCQLTQHGTGVLLIMLFPEGRGSGKAHDALVSHLDVFPTICDLLDVEKPAWLQGHSLLPLVDGKADSIREQAFAEVTFHAAFEPKRNVRTRRWNYIRNFAAPHPTVMPNIDDGHGKRQWVAHGLKDRIVAEEELYDLVFDPLERNNLAADPAFTEIKTDLKTRLGAWMEATNDPLLSKTPDVMPLPQTVNPWSCDNPGKDGVQEWNPNEWALVKPLLASIK